ncbi:unnamed protein product [Acanthoscelides obtectus]|nr:unnamed protein product [Acanthoscelides obtectus]CAK1628051.1 Arrestin domain-containing protein 17 [Acanthoscelides obtectus]
MANVESYPVTSNVFLKKDTVLYTGGTQFQKMASSECQFGIKLPEVLPSTYKNEFGSIRYFLLGIASEDQRHYKTKVKFTLINIIDLNTLSQEFFEPISSYSERKLSFFCFSGGILSLEIFLHKKAFTTGEVATVKVKLKNTSNVRSKSVKLELVERITARIPETVPRSKIHRKVLSRAGCLINFPRGENVFNLPLLIPENFTILKFDGSSIWNVEYYVVATCVLSSWHTDLVVTSDVIIGHIEAYRRHQNPPSLSTRESAPPPYSTLPRNQQHKIEVAESNV